MTTWPVTQTEKQFQAAIVEYAKLNRWLVYHTLLSRGSEPGFPDLVMTRDGAIVFAELKTERGQPTAAQRTWLEALDLTDDLLVIARLWRPRDWPEIEQVLR